MKKHRLIIILRLVLTEAAGDGFKSEFLPRFPVSFLTMNFLSTE
jgi:hypothetical protein